MGRRPTSSLPRAERLAGERLPNPSRSLTIRVKGAQGIQSGAAVLNGRVVDGPLTGARAHAEYEVIECTQSPDGWCFQGTISIKQRDDD